MKKKTQYLFTWKFNQVFLRKNKGLNTNVYRNASYPAKNRPNKIKTKLKIQLPVEKDNDSALPKEIFKLVSSVFKIK